MTQLFSLLTLLAVFTPSFAKAGCRPCGDRKVCCQEEACQKCDAEGASTKLMAGLDPCIADCLADGRGMDSCLKSCYPNRAANPRLSVPIPPEAMPTIECGTGKDAFRVKLDRPFHFIFKNGRYPAKFENLSLVFENTVGVSIDPATKSLNIGFQTAYCGFGVEVEKVRLDEYRVKSAGSNCEGLERELSCKLL